MKRVAFLVVALVLAGCGSAGKPHAFRIVLRHGGEPGDIYKLVWPGSRAKPITIGYYPPDSLRSPDRRLVAFGGEVELKIVDLVHRRAYVPRFGDGCSASPLLWRRLDRLILTVWCGGAHETTRSDLLVLDPARRRFVGRRELGFATSEIAHDQVILLTSPSLGRRIVPGTSIREEREGSARLLRVRPDGHADEITLPIRMGSARSRTFNRTPAFVLDPDRRSAFVIGEGEGCARVDLRTLRVEWHRLRHAFDPQPRLASKAQPHQGTTNASRDVGRQAVWLRDGRIAVSGQDTWTSRGLDRTAPAGLKILDTRRWKVRMVDPLVSTIMVVHGRLVATGPRAGLTVYDRAARRLLHRFAGRQVYSGEVLGDSLVVAVESSHLERAQKAVVHLP